MVTASCQVDNQGRITLPAEWRKAHGVRRGTTVVLNMDESKVSLQTLEQSLKEAQQIVAPILTKGRSLVDDLRRERRRQASLEEKRVSRHAKGVR